MYLQRRKTSGLTRANSHRQYFNNIIVKLLEQSDGKILVAGNFTNYAGKNNRNILVRLNEDGTTDSPFCENVSDSAKFNSTINSVIQQPDGKILVIGAFANYNGTAGRNRLLRLNLDGTLDLSFCINATDGAKFGNTLYSIALQSDGKILVGGSFNGYDSVTGRNKLVRLNSDGTVDSAFCANASDGIKFSSDVRSIAVQPDGKILIGGVFTNYAGAVGRSFLIRLNSDGTLDTAFCVNASDGSKFNTTVGAIVVQPDNNILLGGSFITYAGTTGRNRLLRLLPDGTLDTGFCINGVDGAKFDNTINDILYQPDNTILIAGVFTNYAGTTGRNRLVKFDLAGNLDTSFSANAVDGTKFLDTINSVLRQSDGKILVGGAFTNYQSINRLVRLNSDGTLNNTLATSVLNQPKFGNTISVSLKQSNGDILIGGNFANYAGTALRTRLIRLGQNGALDTVFCGNASDGEKISNTVNDIVEQSDNKILLGGGFVAYAGTVGRNSLVRLNSNGTTDTAFCANAVDGTKFGGFVNSIAKQSDGKILVGGAFTAYAGTVGRNRFVRLNSDGTTDTAFCANAVDGTKFGNNVNEILQQSDGKILVSGAFTNYAGTTGRSYLIRLNSDGTLDTAFCINASDGAKFNNSISILLEQLDGKILVGGNFFNYGGTNARNRLLRLNSDGTLDTAFCINATDGGKFGSTINTLLIQSDGKILVGGFFTNYGGVTGRNRLIRLNSDGTLDTTFCENAVDGVRFGQDVTSVLEIDGGRLLVSGNFSNYFHPHYVITFDRLVPLSQSGHIS
jgi:uncharacterized delta-60 repeat protein